mgnify:FL=1
MKEMANVLLAIYVWGPLMLLALGAAWTLLIFGAWKITTAVQHIANKCYGKFTCKNSVNNKNEK